MGRWSNLTRRDFRQRFGLVYVDFRSLKRTMKESGKWYAKLADTGDLQ